jgi:hypothetical protein
MLTLFRVPSKLLTRKRCGRIVLNFESDIVNIINTYIYKRKGIESHKARTGKNPKIDEHEDQGGMPQQQHYLYPPAQRR